MEIFISEKYFSHLDNIFSQSSHDLLSETPTNIKRIYTLLCSLPVNTNISNKELVKIMKENKGNKQFSNFKESILFKAFKNGLNISTFPSVEAISCSVEAISNFSAYYFLDTEDDSIEKRYGVVAKTNNFQGEEFYGSCSMNVRIENDNWDLVEERCIPPTNAMLLIDPYLLKPFKRKVNSIRRFIEKFIKKCSDNVFHLTFITKSKRTTNIGTQIICTDKEVKKFLEQLQEYKNLNAEIILMNQMDEYNNRQRDRYFFTNYTSINCGHPFEKDRTFFNQTFLGYQIDGQDIINLYQNQKRDLKNWKEKVDNLSEFDENGSRLKWQTTMFTNRLFENLD